MSASSHRIYSMPFAKVYPLYIQKAQRKNRTQAEVDTIIAWLTGYDADGLKRVIEEGIIFEAFFAHAPSLNPHAHLVTGVICGIRVETIEEPLMRNIRILDKLIDELARGKTMEKIVRRNL